MRIKKFVGDFDLRKGYIKMINKKLHMKSIQLEEWVRKELGGISHEF